MQQEDNLLSADSLTMTTAKPVEKLAKLNVPDKFWDKDKQEIRVDALLKSYLELEKKLSSDKQQTLKTPTEAVSVELQNLLVPATPDDYNVTLNHDLFTVDDEINKRLHTAGFTDAQVQLVYDLAAEKMVPLIIELARDFEADCEIAKLVKNFGGMEKWRAVSKQLLAYGQQHFSADIVSGLSGSYEGVMALYRLMQNNTVPNLQDTLKIDGTLDEKGLKKMMEDPKYWRDKDAEMVKKVTAGFKQIFNG